MTQPGLRRIGPAQLGTTAYGYTTDSYSRTAETNAKWHTATISTDPATGLVTSHQAIQGGPITAVVLDSLGRVLKVTASGQQPVEQWVLACSVGNCATVRWTRQAGSPTRVDYLDRLGRVIATGVEDLNGNEILTTVAFNERGAKIADYQPKNTLKPIGSWAGTSASDFMTQYSAIDPLGRVGRKTVSRAGSIFEPGAGDASFVTDYQYSAVAPGTQTCITVQKAVAQGGALIMSRTYDVRGRLASTVQRAGWACAASANQIPTTYSYDATGSLTKILDSSGNALSASYDDLGRKLSVDDPDRGHWDYSWDGLGRLRTQTDARRIVMSYQYDSISRLERRYTQRPADSKALLEANWQYDLNSKPGTLGAWLGVPDPTQGSLADAMVDPRYYYHRDYTYDALLRPTHETTHVPAGPTWAERSFNVDYAYDGGNCRVRIERTHEHLANQHLPSLPNLPRVGAGRLPLLGAAPDDTGAGRRARRARGW